MKIFLLIPCLLLFCFGGLKAQVNVVQNNISIVDENALTISGKFASVINGRTFQKDAIASYKGFQYLAYYDAERHVCLSRRKLPLDNWETIRFLDYYFDSNDAHNVVTLGICPNDGTIHLAFDHHVDTLHYRVSKPGLANKPETMSWDVTAFGPVVSELEQGKTIKITYPRFWQTPDGNLQFNYRQGGSGNGDRMLVDYNGETGVWENTRQIDSQVGLFEDVLGQSNTRCSYPNGYDYDANGKLHTTWVWRESSQGANHDLMYAYSDDQGHSWRNNDGALLNEIINVNSTKITVQSIPRVLGLMNDHGQTIDSKNRIHVVMYHCSEKSINEAGSTLGASRWGPEEAKRYFHYWRTEKGEWKHHQMDFKVGNRPKLFVDKHDNLILIYGGIDNKNHENAQQENHDLIIAVATAKNAWNDWHVAHVVKGPFFNDMLGDFYRWQSEGVLSVMVQQAPKSNSKPSSLQVVDLSFQIK
jgi:hypothetical protein